MVIALHIKYSLQKTVGILLACTLMYGCGAGNNDTALEQGDAGSNDIAIEMPAHPAASEKEFGAAGDGLIEAEEYFIPTRRATRDRLEELSEEGAMDIPGAYLDVVAEHTAVWDRESHISAWDPKGYRGWLDFVEVFFIQGERYAAVLLRHPIPAALHYAPQFHEYHIFDCDAYQGSLSHWINSNDSYAIREYDNSAWLCDVFGDSGRAGSQSYRATEYWYQISNPEFPLVLEYTSQNLAELDGPYGYLINYTAEIADIKNEDYGLELVLDWKEKISLRGTMSISDDVLLFEGGGQVRYWYGETGFERKGPISGNDNYVYELDYTTHGRDRREFLTLYAEELIAIGKYGDEKQKEWLYEYLNDIREWDTLAALTEMVENLVPHNN